MTELTTLKAAGVKKYQDLGVWAYDEWHSHNENYFMGQSSPGEIDWVEVAGNQSMGFFSPKENRIFLFRGLVRPRYPVPMAKWCLENLNRRMASDVLLHEMIHQNIHQTGGWEGECSHNNRRFIDEVNRIAELLGMKVFARLIEPGSKAGAKGLRAEPGCMTLGEIENFPYSKRPRGYYYGRG